MNRQLELNLNTSSPIYAQLVSQIEQHIINAEYPNGLLLPSMNSLAAELNISKETVKKAYLILKARGLVEARQGKGFYVRSSGQDRLRRVIFIFNYLDINKQSILRNYTDDFNECVEICIRIHNNNPCIMERIILEELGRYDRYIATVPTGQEKDAQKLEKLLKRIPSNSLVLI